MKIITHYTLAGLLIAASIQQQAVSKPTRSAKQPFPEKGFWVTETSPDRKSTIVKYYAHSNHLVAEVTEQEVLDVRKLSVRKYLNEQLRKELEKDTTEGRASGFMKSVEILTLVRPIGLVLYFFLAAQGAFYQVGFGKALFDISPEAFIELRKAVDPRVRKNLKALYLLSLVTMLTWLVLTIRSGGLISYASVLAAFLLLVADLVLALKASEPVNELINSDLLNTRQGYIHARAEWMKYIFLRGNLAIAGFVILLLAL